MVRSIIVKIGCNVLRVVVFCPDPKDCMTIRSPSLCVCSAQSNHAMGAREQSQKDTYSSFYDAQSQLNLSRPL